MNESGTLNRSRLPPNNSENNDNASYNAALKGASLAFQKSMPKSTPKQLPTNTTSSRNLDNGALIAATSAASASRDHSQAVSRQNTGSNSIGNEQHIKNQPSVQHLQSTLNRNHGASSSLGIATKHAVPDPRSPSFIAATLAASRSTSPTHHQTAQSHPYAQQLVRKQPKHNPDADSGASSVTSLDLTTDMTSIPSTNTLISIFEKKRDDTDPVKKDTEVPDTSKLLGTKPPIRPLTPPRATSSASTSDLSPSILASNIAWQRTPSPSASITNLVQDGRRKTQDLAVEVKARPPTPPPARTKNKPHASLQPRTLESTGKPRASTPPKPIRQADTVILSPRPTRSTSQKVILNDIQAPDAVPPEQASRPRSQYPPPSNEATVPPLQEDDLRRSSTSSNDTFVSASSVPTPHPSSPERSRSRPSTPNTVRLRRPLTTRTIFTEATSTSRPPIPPRQQSHASSPNLPLESLTDAIVAGSLASSRITLSKTPPPKPPSRKQTPHMRQTLRHPPSKSDDEEVARSRRHKPLGKLGGNKHIHQEGQRRRWREEITPRERKRYEGVWASNRGLLLVPSDGDTLSVPTSASNGKERELDQVVANVVVRDIWARSRLPPDELAEVWDLVDRRGRGYLDRTEFVVGMWLIDQRLRGRKIPRKVSESVWGSARGVRVATPKGRK
ncbi:uncharacterized protein F4812DRAFT_440268 [Daldinia caldariorum]|uniref:uncharacterized protein n=1 Tax=Daldinia caldariorum TaxID=326644 RepID=UPI0020086BBD|nr:uncharacterized protein F4812DRAFT_440268 [Daldinia caldariorum]KAI1465265.1 hypothetical protein F4812DRAFT_440268 [Daldinia caldariorum]